ncbi:hypothetical protein B0H14DRAFT_2876120, partial [Mycena olivaceomarginata]
MWLCLATIIFFGFYFLRRCFLLGGRFRLSTPRPCCAHFYLSLLSIRPSQYLSSRIVHLIYTLPTRTLHARTQCLLLHP